MTTQQPEALRLTEIARYCFRSEGMSDPPEQFESPTGDMVDYFDHVEIEKELLARITELESQLAPRFDAAAHGPTSGAADLPEALRVPLDSLHADAGYLCGRLLNGSLTQEQVVESIRRRIDAAKLAALTAQAISAEPAEHVQNPAENEHVAGDVSGNGAGLNMSTPHARITELESQLAQRFDAADMATAAAQGFRDGVASVSAGSEPVAEIGSAAGDCAAFGERALYPLVDIDRFDYGTMLYTHPSPPEGMAGWKWVPIEPTDAMWNAMMDWGTKKSEWLAILDAAPAPVDGESNG